MKDGQTRLIKVCNKPIAEVSKKALEAFATYAGISRCGSRTTKHDICNCIVQKKLNVPLLNRIDPTQAATITTSAPPSGSTKGSYPRLINCLSLPRIKILYADFKKQPSKDILTAGKKAHADMCTKIMAYYTNDEDDGDDDDEDDELNVGVQKYKHDRLEESTIDPSKFKKVQGREQILKMIKTLH